MEIITQSGITSVTQVSRLTGKENTMVLPVTHEELVTWATACESTRPLIQHAFPHLSADEREFLICGVTPEEWDDYFGGEDE